MLSDDEYRRLCGKLYRAARSWPGPHPIIIIWRSFRDEMRDWCHENGLHLFDSNGRTVAGVPIYLVPDRSTEAPFDIGEADDPRIAAVIASRA